MAHWNQVSFFAIPTGPTISPLQEVPHFRKAKYMPQRQGCQLHEQHSCLRDVSEQSTVFVYKDYKPPMSIQTFFWQNKRSLVCGKCTSATGHSKYYRRKNGNWSGTTSKRNWEDTNHSTLDIKHFNRELTLNLNVALLRKSNHKYQETNLTV